MDEYHHADVSGGRLRPAVFGAMDGLVTNIALISGVGGAGVEPHQIVLTGIAGLVAGAISMGLGEYTSVRAQEELCIDPNETPSPWMAAILSFVCFSAGALVPLLPYLFGATSLWLALAAGGVGLFVSGALVARFTNRNWWSSGLRQLVLGCLAAAATYGVGRLIGATVA